MNLTIGFNSTMRRLEDLAGTALPSQYLSAVFVCRNTVPSVLTDTFPLLTAMASQRQPQRPAVRLVPLSQANCTKLADLMRLPRLGALGLGACIPAAEALNRLILKQIEPVDVPWLRESTQPRYMPMQLESSEHDMREKPDKASKMKKSPT